MPEWNEAAWFSWLAGAALKSTLVLGAAWLAAVVLRRRSAAAQHLVWTAAAVALLSLPLLSVAVPAVRVTVPAGLTPPGLIIQTTAVERARVPANGEGSGFRGSACSQANPAFHQAGEACPTKRRVSTGVWPCCSCGRPAGQSRWRKC